MSFLAIQVKDGIDISKLIEGLNQALQYIAFLHDAFNPTPKHKRSVGKKRKVKK